MVTALVVSQFITATIEAAAIGLMVYLVLDMFYVR